MRYSFAHLLSLLNYALCAGLIPRLIVSPTSAKNVLITSQTAVFSSKYFFFYFPFYNLSNCIYFIFSTLYLHFILCFTAVFLYFCVYNNLHSLYLSLETLSYHTYQITSKVIMFLLLTQFHWYQQFSFLDSQLLLSLFPDNFFQTMPRNTSKIQFFRIFFASGKCNRELNQIKF